MAESTQPNFERVALAISAYRSDASVIALLRQVFDEGHSSFGAVIVVDSCGSGAIRDAIRDTGWKVDYRDYPQNLGSAGNLAERLKLAAGLDLDWCCTINHDATFRPDLIGTMLDLASNQSRIGAVYPRLVFTSADNREDRARYGLNTFSILDGPKDESPAWTEVAWSSSNGALYNLAAVREGVNAWPELWMGWEDLALGWQLTAAGWGQILCNVARLEDSYEYRRTNFLGKGFYLAEKPPWYSYYLLRNLLIIRKRSRGEAVGLFGIAVRGAADLAATLLFRDRKLERWQLLFEGISAGLRGVTGKGPVP